MAGSAIIKEWDTNTEYLTNETVYTSDDPEISVQYQNKFYRATADHTSLSFGTDWGNDLWEEMTVKGVQGVQGPPGIRGPKGDTGTQGPAGANGAAGADGVFSEIASQLEAETGTDNVKGMTPLRTQQNFDANISSRDSAITTNANDIISLAADVSTNTSDIASITIDSAQITTNKNDIAGLVLVDAGLQNQIDNITIDSAQITQNQNDIATINNTTIPAINTEINKLKGRVAAVENSTTLSNASGEQNVENNAGPIAIVGGDISTGSGNRWELNSDGATSARIRAEIYREDDAETRFTVAMLEMHFLSTTNTWVIGRTWTTAFEGNPDGLDFTVVTTDLGGGIYVGQVYYTSDNMVGGNYNPSSYVRFLLEEISK